MWRRTLSCLMYCRGACRCVQKDLFSVSLRKSHRLNMCSIAVVPVDRCLNHVYFTSANGFTDEFTAIWTTRWEMLGEVVTGCVSLKGLSGAQGLPSASLMYPTPHILPADPLPHFRPKALKLADLGPKPLKLLASVNLSVTLFLTGICPSNRTQPSTRRKK